MSNQSKQAPTMNGRDPSFLRGDAITGDRYYSKEFAEKEWTHLWTRIWHIAGRLADMREAGDYVVHNFLKESVIAVRQDDGSIRAFYNSCRHRGMRLVHEDSSTEQFVCPYHGWRYAKNGLLMHAQDSDVDFPQGSPVREICGSKKSAATHGAALCGTRWTRTVRHSLEYLNPIPEVAKNYPMDTAVRVAWYRIALNANWKFVTDNFSESYHTRTAHPQVPAWIDQDVNSARHEMWRTGSWPHGSADAPVDVRSSRRWAQCDVRGSVATVGY